MFSKSPDLVQNSLQIKKEDKFLSRILSRDTSNPSFRFYNYEGKPGAIPFLWESRPGTPKCAFHESTLVPPLTPPPSYYFNSNKNPIKKTSSSRAYKLLHFLFPKMLNLKKTNSSSVSYWTSTLSSSSSWSSSTFSTVVPVTSPKKYRNRLRGRRGLSFDSRVGYHNEEDQAEMGSSPTSTLCFGVGKGSCSSSGGGGLLRGRGSIFEH